MATLQKIRTKAGLLVAIVIGISLAAFILGDLLKSGSSIMRKDQMKIGEVNGESIQYPDFQKQVEELGEIYKQNSQQTQLDENTWVQVREQAWQSTVRNLVMSDVYNDLGIEISSDELFDMLQGTNPHQIVQQIFRNPETGQFDRGAVVRFLKNLDVSVSPEQRSYWLYLENQIQEERVQNKYANMVGKGLFVTSAETQQSVEMKNKKVNFDYIALNMSSVNDSLISVSDNEMRDYYDKHKENYKEEKIRKIEYITFPVNPSATDFEEAEKWINEIKPDFEKTVDNIQFVNSNSDTSFDPTWKKKDDLPENIGVWVFDENAKVNDVFGPYFENETYTLAKVNDIKMMPDSVEARHILLRVNSQAELAAAQTLADSLKTAIENGSDFATLAREFSTDGTAQQGGDLGWFKRGQMVAPFEEAAFTAAKNEVKVVGTQFGLHVIQTTNRGGLSKQVQVAFLNRKVEPSTRTYQEVYAQASKFAGENTTRADFDAAIVEQKLTKRVANVRENDRVITGLENARNLIRDAYNAEEGDIILSSQGSPIFELGDNFVIAVLAQATEEGVAPFENVKERVRLAVQKEKKATYLVEKVKSAMIDNSDLATLATALNTTVKNANAIDFSAISVPGIGLEPAVVGTATSLEVDKMSKPFVGNNAVFVVKVTSITNGTDNDVANEQFRLAQSLNYRATSQAYEAHRKASEIIDLRSKFY